jgi:valyl-tRNA synthetase
MRGLRIYVHDISDDAADRERTTKALGALEKQIAGKESKLNNAQFVANAPAELVETERARLSELQAQFTSLKEHLRELADTD